jgi:N-acetylglutamate synthase-like GNAT family acetyltransferase
MYGIPGLSIRHNIKPGDVGYIIHLHGYLYFQEYGYDSSFEVYVAGPLSEFASSKKAREQIWILEKDDKIVGSMAIVEHSMSEAQLRWLLLHPNIRGIGLGKKLMDDAIAFCKANGYSLIFLWTEDLLKPATKLYKSRGFTLTEEKTHELWGMELTEQRYELKLR